MNRPPLSPFDSVENAHQYVRLLVEAIAEAKSEIAADLGSADRGSADRAPGPGAAGPAQRDRRVEALRLVQFKLDKLEQHLESSSRLLNDLRTLRRLLFEERPESTPVGKDSAA